MNVIYETAKISDEEGDYVDMEDIDTEEEPQYKCFCSLTVHVSKP